MAEHDTDEFESLQIEQRATLIPVPENRRSTDVPATRITASSLPFRPVVMRFSASVRGLLTHALVGALCFAGGVWLMPHRTSIKHIPHATLDSTQVIQRTGGAVAVATQSVPNNVSKAQMEGAPSKGAPQEQQKTSVYRYPIVFDSAKQQFEYLDMNRDGFLTGSDLSDLVGTAYADSLGLPLFSSTELDLAIGLADENNDSKVSLEEFKKYSDSEIEKQIQDEDRKYKQIVAACTNCLNATGLKAKILGAESANASALAPKSPRQLRERRYPNDRLMPRHFRNDGIIHGLWTFGAPATSYPQFTNGLEEDGVFPGFRVWTMTRIPGWWWGYYQKQDPVAWITTFRLWQNYIHARMDSVTLRDFDEGTPDLQRSSGDQSWWPMRDPYYWVCGHTSYQHLASKQTQHPFLAKLAVFSFAVYQDHEPGIVAKLKEATPGWNLDAMVTVKEKDTLLLIKEASTNDCVLVFRGSDDFSDWMANLNFVSAPWCGFPEVHRGFRDQLKEALSCSQYKEKVRPKLSKCSSVHAAGHSLGGAQAEIFAACVMNPKSPGENGYNDYKLVSWETGPAFEVEYSSPPGACYLTNHGKCVTDGIGLHDNNEHCRIKALRAVKLQIKEGDFDTETWYDFVEIGGVRYSGKHGPHGVDLRPGQLMTWKADYSIVNGGFVICGK